MFGVELKITFLVCLIGLLIEHFLPREKIKLFYREKGEDFFWFSINRVINFILFPVIITITSTLLSLYFHPRFKIAQLPFALEFMILFIILDFSNYLIHRTYHSVGFLWDFHKLHHSTTELSVLSAFRHSWVESSLTTVMIGLISGSLGGSATAIFASGLFFSSLCLIQHLNTSARLPRWVESWMITPHNHLWHHSKKCHFRYGQNFGFTLTIWDKIFGTYYVPEKGPSHLGLEDLSYPSKIGARLIYPIGKALSFRRR